MYVFFLSWPSVLNLAVIILGPRIPIHNTCPRPFIFSMEHPAGSFGARTPHIMRLHNRHWGVGNLNEFKKAVVYYFRIVEGASLNLCPGRFLLQLLLAFTQIL